MGHSFRPWKGRAIAILALLAALLLAKAGFAAYRASFDPRYESFRREKLTESLSETRDLFLDRVREAVDLADSLAVEIGEEGLLGKSGGFERMELFRLLARHPRGPRISGIEVRDLTGGAVAWSGKTFDLELDVPFRRTSGIHRSRMYRAIYAVAPVLDAGAAQGSVVVFLIFDRNFHLHNRYLTGIDFEVEVNELLGLEDIDISRKEGAVRRAEGDPHRLAGSIENEAGETIAHVNVQIFTKEAYLTQIDHARGKVEGALITLLLLLVSALLGQAALRRRAPLWLTPLFAVVALAARSGLYQAGFPAILSLGSVFEPSLFTLIVGVGETDLGWLHSPGDLLLTGIFLLAVTAVVLTVLGRRLAPRLLGRRRPLRGAILLPAALTLAGLAVSLWIELLGAVAFNSRIEFFSAEAVLPKAPEASVLLGLFLVTVTLVLWIAAALLVPLRLLAGRNRMARLAGHLAAVPGLLLALQLFTNLSLVLGLVTACTLGAGLAVAAYWPVLGVGLRYATLTLVVTILTFPSFLREVWREVRADVEENAEVLFHPAGLRSPKHVLEMDLVELTGKEWFISRLSRPPDEIPPDLAFRLWAEGPLSRRLQGCDVVLRRPDGRSVISRFEIDMPLRSWLPDPLPGTAPDELVVWPPLRGKEGGRRQRFLVGSAPIHADDGRLLAQLIVRMPADRPSFGRTPRPEFLKPNDAADLSAPARELFYSEYRDGALVLTTNPEYPRLHRLSDAVRKAILTDRLDQLWIREKIAGAWWVNLYRPRYEEEGLAGIACVGFRSRETRSVLVSGLILLLVNAVGALACSFVVMLFTIRRFSLRFQHKLLISYLVVSAIPVTLLAQVNQSLAEETVSEQLEESLARTVRQVKAELHDRGITDLLSASPGRAPEVITDEAMKEIGYRVGQEVNLFLIDPDGRPGAPLLASSEPGIFATELFSDHLSGEAYLETVIRGREFYTARETVGDYSYMVGYTPLRSEEERVLAVIGLPLVYGQDAVDKELDRRNSLILALYLLILLVVVFIGMLLARRISSPIERLAEATKRVSAGDLEYRIPGRSRDEFGYLLESFNRMTEDLRKSREKLVKAEKDAAWREMAKQVAHEIKNPLTPMRLSAQQILRSFRDDHEDFDEILSEGIDLIIRQTETLSRIAGEFSAFARLPTRRLRNVDLSSLAREVGGLYQASRDVRLVTDLCEVPPVLADPDELRRVIVNLAANAVQAMEPEGGTLTIRTGVQRILLEGRSRRMVRVSLTDTGVGIPPGDLDQLFEPSFSTKTGGTGLGLAISHAVVNNLGGAITVESEVGRATTFTVYLPPAMDSPPAPDASEEE